MFATFIQQLTKTLTLDFEPVRQGLFSASWLWPQPGTLASGALVKFTIPGPKTKFYFIGPVLKKPIVHVLVEGFPCEDDRVSVLCPSTSWPHFVTSQQFFQQALEEAPGPLPVSAIPFEVLSFQAGLYEQLVEVKLIMTSEGGEKTFEVTSQKPQKKTRSGALPFGLKRPTKPRAPAVRKKPKVSAKASAVEIGTDSPQVPSSPSASSSSSSSSSSNSEPEVPLQQAACFELDSSSQSK